MIWFFSAQDCLLATNGDRPLPNFVNPGSSLKQRFRRNPIQAIISSYRFNCCGVITEWGAFVERSGEQFENGTYSISFQVWRPNSVVDNCYTKTGSNFFQNILLDTDTRGLVRETPLVSERIEVQPGDVIGFNLTNTGRKGKDNGITFAQKFNDDDYRETVWYDTGTITTGSPSCPFPVGIDGTLSSSTNVAPVISVSVCKLILLSYNISYCLALKNLSVSHK